MDRQKIEKVFKLYLKPPFKDKVDIDKLQAQETIVLNSIVMREIVPDVFAYLRQENKEENKRLYIQELIEALIDAGYCTYIKGDGNSENTKNKKKTYREMMNEMINPKEKADSEYFKEHQLYLQRTLVKPDKTGNLDKM